MLKLLVGTLGVILLILTGIAIMVATNDRTPSEYPTWLWPVLSLAVLLVIGGAIAWRKLQEHHDRPLHKH